MLGDLQNSVATGVLLVAVVILFALGFRASLFIGIAIPASFLAGVLGLQLAGLTINIVVLFSLILAVGMLVDDAIIVSEFAERRMAEGMPPKRGLFARRQAHGGPGDRSDRDARRRVLAAAVLARRGRPVHEIPADHADRHALGLARGCAVLHADARRAAGQGRAARRCSTLTRARDGRDPICARCGWRLRHPGTTLALAACLLVVVQLAYGRFGRGVEFFPNVEPDYGQVIVHARGNLALEEKNRLVGEVERRVLQFDGLKTVYARIGEQPRGMSELTEDTIGVIQFEFADWRSRPPAHADHGCHPRQDRRYSRHSHRSDGAARRSADRQADPGADRRARSGALPAAAAKVSRRSCAAIPTCATSTTASRFPGIDWRIEVNKAEAAKYGAGVDTVGSAIQLVTNGLKATEYRPVDSDKSVDILVRFPPERRSLDEIDDLRIQTPIGTRADRKFRAARAGAARGLHQPRQRQSGDDGVGQCRRGRAVRQSAAGRSRSELAKADLGPGVTFRLKGEDEERAKASAFLLKAFGTAIFLIFAILLAQFNKLTSVGLVLTAVVLSTFGVLLGLLVMGQAFGVVMTGIGVIANAGVIVNNNIVLIDTYDRLRREGVAAYDAIIETCRERARPVVLTAVTAILGVLPIAFGMNIEFFSREITVGAPATQWWINLSTAIVFGLGFATVLTLIVTPAALMAIENLRLARLRWTAVGARRFLRAARA